MAAKEPRAPRRTARPAKKAKPRAGRRAAAAEPGTAEAAREVAERLARQEGRPRAGSRKARPRKGGKFAAHEPTPEQRSQAATMSGLGLTHEQIAVVLGISADTLTRHYQADLDRGHAQAVATIAGGLFSQARAGNLGAQIFWLKARAGWRERQVVEHAGKIGVAHEVGGAADAALVAAVAAVEREIQDARSGSGPVSGNPGGGGGAAGMGEGAAA
jgi:hypothetical protein